MSDLFYSFVYSSDKARRSASVPEESRGCFLGLLPGRRDSGESQPQMPISKEGDPYLRTMLAQGADYILGPLGKIAPFAHLSRSSPWGRHLATRVASSNP
jgi:transposase